MLNRKTILFSVIAISAFCFFSCGKNTKGSLSSSQNTEAQTTLNITNSFSETTNSDEKYDAYLKSELNELANILFREADYYFSEFETDADIIYSNVRNDDGFGREIVRQSPRVGEIEYIFIFDSNKKVETAIVWTCLDDKKYVGCGGKMESIEEINAHNWDEVLAYYGLKEGEYTNLYSEESKTES
ncbi:hypothetical protein [Ruminococcus flavefaciens]|uniref:Lipoprotein n=1 Tax=Ruminococcus flavefaciens TaxID=1265 RepID=A0A1M7M3T6_RUMFL|nr:hypothetical protein [Ruminococcus flavefaciens]SHM85290.1 hypothetical protein SAMN04487860_11840 [Ruminococcus flavefaciens]